MVAGGPGPRRPAGSRRSRRPRRVLHGLGARYQLARPGGGACSFPQCRRLPGLAHQCGHSATLFVGRVRTPSVTVRTTSARALRPDLARFAFALRSLSSLGAIRPLYFFFSFFFPPVLVPAGPPRKPALGEPLIAHPAIATAALNPGHWSRGPLPRGACTRAGACSFPQCRRLPALVQESGLRTSMSFGEVRPSSVTTHKLLPSLDPIRLLFCCARTLPGSYSGPRGG